MTQETVSKPIPQPDEESKPFWDATLKGQLLLMKCKECGTARLPSRHHCDNCLSDQFDWVQSSGKGTVRTFGVMHQKYHPGFADEMPYTIAIVELEEGPRLPSNLINLEGREVKVGMPVIVEWEKHEDVALPKFRPA